MSFPPIRPPHPIPTTAMISLAAVAATASPAAAQVDANPSNNGLPGAGLAQSLLDWAGWIGLVGSLLAVLVGAAVWGLSQQAGNAVAAGRGRALVTGGAIGAFLVGVGPTLVNTLFAAGGA